MLEAISIHIWTFAAGAMEVSQSNSAPNSGCPCDMQTMIVSLHLLEMISFMRVAYTLNGMVVLDLYFILMMSSEIVQ